MARIVLILGAGASAPDGAPTMREFYDRAMSVRRLPDLDRKSQEAFDLVQRGYKELMSVYANTSMGYHENFEELYASFEMAEVLGTLGGFEASEIGNLPGAIRRVICDTIELSLEFPQGQGQIQAPKTYGAFAQPLAEGFKHKGTLPSLAVLTFNYDIGLDFALEMNGLPVNYCLHDAPSNEGIPLLKLHGSLNWSRCPEPDCGKILTLGYKSWAAVHKRQSLPSNMPSSRVRVSRDLTSIDHIHPQPADPFLVPPTWNKTSYHQQIARVWRRASAELSEAEHIFIVGFSLSPTDQFFRHLFALSMAKSDAVQAIEVVNNDGDAFKRVGDMLGEQLRGRLTKSPVLPFESRAESLARYIAEMI